MSSQHKHNPISFRPAERDRVLLLAYQQQTGYPLNAILTDAVHKLLTTHDHGWAEDVEEAGGLCPACLAGARLAGARAATCLITCPPGTMPTALLTARCAPDRWNADAARITAPTSTTDPPATITRPPTRCRSVVFFTTQMLTEVTTSDPENPHAQAGSLLLDVLPDAAPEPAACCAADPADVGQFPDLTHPATTAAFATRAVQLTGPVWCG